MGYGRGAPLSQLPASIFHLRASGPARLVRPIGSMSIFCRLVLGLAATVQAAPKAFGAADLEQNFLHPPASARPWVFWFWLNGNVTSNGITADLEAMNRVGIGGVIIMEVDEGTPEGPVAFGSRPWLDLFRHVCGEAHRLGLQVSMNNDAGWSGSGGPWITPELSMQKVVWSERTVSGPGRFDGVLEQPETVARFYSDIGAFAFPTPPEDEVKMADYSPKLTSGGGGLEGDRRAEGGDRMASDLRPLTSDLDAPITLARPESAKPVFVQIEFARPFRARRLVLDMGLKEAQTCHCLLQTSDDGQAFSTIREFDTEALKLSYNFAEVAARWFRILFTSADPELKQLVVAKLDLDRRFQIEDIAGKALFVRKHNFPGPSEFAGRANYPAVPGGLAISPQHLLDVSPKLDREGHLHWDVPEGSWTVLRMGYTSTGTDNHPAPSAGRGLECDKLSKKAARAMFDGLMTRLSAAVGPLTGRTFVGTHIDSWEVGSQNWTPRFRQEFRRHRGYDPLPFLPVITGRVVDNLEVSERFLWDWRQTISELLADNYAGHFRALAHRHGLRLSVEAYGDNPCDDLVYAGRADQPMGEFWSWPPFEVASSCTEMASAAHIYGKHVVGAEAFTATDAEKWLGHPFAVKLFGDWAFSEGINRLVVHRYALQPWTHPERRPGMSMGPWGLHFERTQTWWEQSKTWLDYTARCQYLLQQGLFVADICYLAAETAPRRWAQPGDSIERPGYNFDACPAEVVLNRMSVKNGRLTLPDGMSYRLLVLPESQTMTPQLLARIRLLVEAGATIVGAPPAKAPGLSGYPQCDEQVRRLVKEIWGDCDGKTVTQHRLGKGWVVRGLTPQQVLARAGVPPDFLAQVENRNQKSDIQDLESQPAQGLSYTHRTLSSTDLYFVASRNLHPEEVVCAFRQSGLRPELWWPDSGRIERPAVYEETNGTVRLPLRFDPCGSVFVVFRSGMRIEPQRITSVMREGNPEVRGQRSEVGPPPSTLRPPSSGLYLDITNTFTMAGWVKPEIGTALPDESDTGVSAYPLQRNDALFPPPGHEVYSQPRQACAGLSVGTNGVCVLEHSVDYFPPLLVLAVPLTNWTHIAVVYRNGRPRLYLNGKFAREGLQSFYTVHPGVGVRHRRGSIPFQGGLVPFQLFPQALSEPEILRLMESEPAPAGPAPLPAFNLLRASTGALDAEVWEAGTYLAKTAQGETLRIESGALPKPLEITGPWELQFPPGSGAPERVSLPGLLSWSDHTDPGIKYFSGAATYKKTFHVPEDLPADNRRLYLNLGKVAVIAQINLNGEDLGTLWKPPFTMDVTKTIRPGDNELEIRVVNLWVNRMIADEQLPEDSERKENGTLKRWPQWLLDGLPSSTRGAPQHASAAAAGRYTFTTWRLWKKDAPLQTSGLLGPVTIVPTTMISIPAAQALKGRP